jgi:hypothetical protein
MDFQCGNDYFWGKWYSVLSSSECEQMSLLRLQLESRVNGDLIYGIGQVLSASFTFFMLEDSKLLAELVLNGSWAVWAEQDALYT